jgi:hypothetical protein
VGNDAEGFYHELGELIDNNFDGCGCWWSQVQRKYKGRWFWNPAAKDDRGTGEGIMEHLTPIRGREGRE